MSWTRGVGRRLSDPTQAMSGNSSSDAARIPTDPLHFSTVECEHGPAVAEYGFGPLPAGTQPGVPHCYDGLTWIPGSYIGNQRGALLRPQSTFVYGQGAQRAPTTSTWTPGDGGDSRSTALRCPRRAYPIIGHDEERQRSTTLMATWIFQTKTQVNRNWTNRSATTSARLRQRTPALVDAADAAAVRRHKHRTRNAACDSQSIARAPELS